MYSQIEGNFYIYFFLYIKMQEILIKIQLTPISKYYLKLNSQFSTKIIYTVHNKFLQTNDLSFC